MNGQKLAGQIVKLNSHAIQASEKRSALICGINNYRSFPNLSFATNDARSVAEVLRHPDRGRFTEVTVLTDSEVTRSNLRKCADRLFRDNNHLALFYFAGHGVLSADSGLLVTHDGEPFDEGISLRDLAGWVRTARANQTVVLLDCCHAGVADIREIRGTVEQASMFDNSHLQEFAALGRGKVLLAAATMDQRARETARLEHGVFTYYFLQGCAGDAASNDGHVTITGLHGFIARKMPASQTPVLKGEIERDIVLISLDAIDDSQRQRAPVRIVHPLTPAPNFVGREDQIGLLREFVLKGRGVLSVIGFGGTGKTALVQRVLSEVAEQEHGKPAAIFVWSFYDDQNTNQFLREAYRYFSGGQESKSKGSGIVYELTDLLAKDEEILIILDGLERVQHQSSTADGVFGELEDKMLKLFLCSLFDGMPTTKCVVTSRFDLTDLQPWQDHGYCRMELHDLGTEDALQLLYTYGIGGTIAAKHSLISEFGTHALTLNYLAAYIVQFCHRDPTKAIALEEPSLEGQSTTERKLARILRAYEAALSQVDLALLCRLCAFRHGLTALDAFTLFAQSGNEKVSGALLRISERQFKTSLSRLNDLHLVDLTGNERYGVHPVIRDHFLSLLVEKKTVHESARKHFSTLIGKPGTALPEDTDTLNLYEELVYHSIQSGAFSEATSIYWDRLGGARHLGWNLGQYDRGKRLLDCLQTAMSMSQRLRDETGFYLRAMGDMAEAGRRFQAEVYQGLVWILKGELSMVMQLKDPIFANEQMIVAHMRGTPLKHIYSLHLYTQTLMLIASEIRHVSTLIPRRVILEARSEWLKKKWNDDVSSATLALAQYARLQGDVAQCHDLIDEASEWINRAGSQEHLFLLFHLESQLALDAADLTRAERNSNKAIQIARRCGFGLYLINALITSSRVALTKAKYDVAILASTEAIELARTEACSYLWAVGDALHVLGQAYHNQNDQRARSILSEAFAIRSRIKDNEAERTFLLLNSI